MRWLLLVVSGCFFEPARPTQHEPDGGATIDAPESLANYMFVTSTTIVPATLGGLSQADTTCHNAAIAAGLPDETYVAWLSTSAIDAVTRLGQARGWQRPRDHLPVADTKAKLANGQLLYPPRLDERGNPMPETTIVLTATSSAGTRLPDTCADFTSTTGTVEVGAPDGAGNAWSTIGAVGCTTPVHLYCLGITRMITIPAMAPAGRLGFVTTDAHPISDGASVADLDNFCGVQAGALAGSFKAFVGVGTNPPNARFDRTKGPWYRLDGVAFAQQALVGFDAPLHQDGHGDYIERDVMFGAASPGAVASGTCADWSQSGASTMTGDSGRSSTGAFTGQSLIACGIGANLYCLAE